MDLIKTTWHLFMNLQWRRPQAASAVTHSRVEVASLSPPLCIPSAIFDLFCCNTSFCCLLCLLLWCCHMFRLRMNNTCAICWCIAFFLLRCKLSFRYSNFLFFQTYRVIVKKVSFGIFRIILISKEEKKNYYRKQRQNAFSVQVFMKFGHRQNHQN